MMMMMMLLLLLRTWAGPVPVSLGGHDRGSLFGLFPVFLFPHTRHKAHTHISRQGGMPCLSHLGFLHLSQWTGKLPGGGGQDPTIDPVGKYVPCLVLAAAQGTHAGSSGEFSRINYSGEQVGCGW